MILLVNSFFFGIDTFRFVKMICYFFDDLMLGDFLKRFFFVGFRFNIKVMRYYISYVEFKIKEEVTDNGRWLSVFYLIV